MRCEKNTPGNSLDRFLPATFNISGIRA